MHLSAEENEELIGWLTIDAWDPVFGGDLPLEFSAWLAGRAYRRRHGPRPDVADWNDGSPYAKAMGLYPDNQNQRVEWEAGWEHEHRRNG